MPCGTLEFAAGNRVISTDPLEGKQTMMRGLIVAPGFIDLHQHGQDAETTA